MKKEKGVSARWMGGALCLGCLMFSGLCAKGAELFVNASSSNPVSPYTGWATSARRIQDAVDAANPGDVVWVTNGTYNIGGRVVPGQQIPNRVAVMKSIRVQSVGGAGVTEIIGVGPVGAQNVRCVFLTNGASLVGFTLRRGVTADGTGPWSADQSGGGAFLAGGTLSDCILISNAAVYGGGAFVAGGVLTNCVITMNQAKRFPGSGGGAYCVYGGMITDCQVWNNTGLYGSGIFCDADGLVRHCTMTSNRVTQNGGAVFCAPSGLVLCCAQSSNHADQQGGGVYLWKGGALRGSLVKGNSSDEGGGVCFAGGGVVDGCTIVGNTSAAGGGFRAYSAGAVWNSIVQFNASAVGSNYLLSGSGADIVHSCLSPLSNGSGNISLNPAFINTEGGDYRLSADSPCINSGINEEWMKTVTDLSGRPRIWIDVVDIGAYEDNPSSLHADTDSDSLPDWWEWQWFAHVTNGLPTMDDDGDGHTAGQEYVAGTDPFDVESSFRVDMSTRSSAGIRLVWPSVAGRYYSLYRLTNLLCQANTAPVFEHVAATPPQNVYQDSDASLEQGFYKMKVVNEEVR